MTKPQDFSFNFDHDSFVGSYVFFTYVKHNSSEDIWDDLEQIIQDNFPGLYRLEESSYEFSGNIDQTRTRLKNFGFIVAGDV